MFYGVVAVAFLSALLASAARGSTLGFGLGVAVIGLILVAMVHGAVYLVARMFSIGMEATGYAPVDSKLPPPIDSDRSPFDLTRSDQFVAPGTTTVPRAALQTEETADGRNRPAADQREEGDA